MTYSKLTKISIGLIAAAMLAPTAVAAAEWTDESIVGSWETGVYVDNSMLAARVQFDSDGEYSVMLRDVAEHLGYNVGWDDETTSIELISEQNEIKIVVGSDKCEKNGKEIKLSKPVYIPRDGDRSYMTQSFLRDV